MKDARFERVLLRRADLRRAFAPDFTGRLTGATVLDVQRRAKYLRVPLSTGEVLVMHLGMSGDFRVARGDSPAVPPGPHDHVVFEMSSGAIVTFSDPRRFGSMDLLADGKEPEALRSLGPEPLSDHFDAAALAAACARRKAPLKAALLDQRVVAGLGNIYVVEALHRARLSPRRRASTIATPRGAPRATAERLVHAIKDVLKAAVTRQLQPSYRAERFRVYDRAGEPCPTTGCAGTIRRIVQAGRSTFFCPVCQR